MEKELNAFREYWENLDRFALKHGMGNRRNLSNYFIYDRTNQTGIEIWNRELERLVVQEMERRGAEKIQMKRWSPVTWVFQAYDRLFGRWE